MLINDPALAAPARDRDRDLVAWLRAVPPDRVVEETVALLRSGVAEDDLWAAGALTATRYILNQARNLLGFVSHAMIGCEDARRLAADQPDHVRHTLLIQALHQVSADIADPCFSPFELPPFWPLYDRDAGENVRQLRSDVRFGETLRADHRLVGLERQLNRAALVDLILEIGLEGMVTDDHTLLTPELCLGMGDLVGWEAGFDMLRCAMRYSASFPRNFAPYDRALGLLARYGLEAGAPNEVFDAEQVPLLRAEFLTAVAADRPEIAARALAAGAAPATVLAAVSLAGCDMYLAVDPVPHGDYDAISREVAPMHLGTSTNALRAALRRMSPRTRALAAIQGGSMLERGPSILSPDFAFVPYVAVRPYPYAEDLDALRGSDPTALLNAMRDGIVARDCRAATAAAQRYGASGASAEPLIAALIAIACTDDGTLLHSVKHLHAMVDEFRACEHPDRWKFLVAAARFMSWYAGKDTGVYKRAVALV